jgi:hypothetical protein
LSLGSVGLEHSSFDVLLKGSASRHFMSLLSVGPIRLVSIV